MQLNSIGKSGMGILFKMSEIRILVFTGVFECVLLSEKGEVNRLGVVGRKI